jgi:pimeloyl-ACP methyl ester carboxylesterase
MNVPSTATDQSQAGERQVSPAPPALPIVYVRGYAGPTSGIDSQIDDPFYGFNTGATHVRVGGDRDPLYYQFEGPMLRLMIDEDYQLLVRGDQRRFLIEAEDDSVPTASLWVYRFYDQAATTFVPPPPQGLLPRVTRWLNQQVTADGFDIETAATGLYDLIMLIRAKTGAAKVHIIAHSMGGLVARCMIQKVCFQRDEKTGGKRFAAKDVVAKLFTYGTPHGGIATDVGAIDWAVQAFGPAGADIFSPAKMYGYLTPGKRFGQTAPVGADWDPQAVAEEVFNPADIFCVVGTDPKDYGAARLIVGPKSDGLVRIEHAYVRKAHRAFVYRSHSGSYGEVNSEEGYQNLRRFLFGRWQVQVTLDDLPSYPSDPDEQATWATWQADMRLTVRGLPVILSEQQAEHWCPIQLNDELQRSGDSPDHPVPLVSTFLLDPARNPQRSTVVDRPQKHQPTPHDGRARHVLTLRVFQLQEGHGFFRFSNHLEQVPDWADSLIVDVGPAPRNGHFGGWAAWNHDVQGPNADADPIGPPLEFTRVGNQLVTHITLPDAARFLPILGPAAKLTLRIQDLSATPS